MVVYDVLSAFGEPCVLMRSFAVPPGPVSGIAVLQGQLVEALGHGWDLARATGRTLGVRDRIVELVLGRSVPVLTAQPPGLNLFAPPHPVDGDAPVLERLAASLGRRPGP